MDNQTTLFVIGDHGMTATGDHGGDTDDETNALLFAYTKRSKFLTSEFGSDADEMQQVNTKDHVIVYRPSLIRNFSSLD